MTHDQPPEEGHPCETVLLHTGTRWSVCGILGWVNGVNRVTLQHRALGVLGKYLATSAVAQNNDQCGNREPWAQRKEQYGSPGHALGDAARDDGGVIGGRGVIGFMLYGISGLQGVILVLVSTSIGIWGLDAKLHIRL